MSSIGRHIRRIILGPTDEEVSAESQALGGPRYPIPPIVNTQIPTPLADHGRFLAADWADRLRDAENRAAGERGISEGEPDAVLLRPLSAGRLAAAEVIAGARVAPAGRRPAICDGCEHSEVMHIDEGAEVRAWSCIGDGPGYACPCTHTAQQISNGDVRSHPYQPKPWDDAEPEAAINPVPYAPGDPDGTRAASEYIQAVARTPQVGRPHPIPDLDRDHIPHPDDNGATMTDTPRAATESGNESDGIDVPLDRPDPVTDSGVHAAPTETVRPAVRTRCATCEGRGYVERTINDILRESLTLIPVDSGDRVIREFYTRLINAVPDLAPLFPRDLLTAATQDGASPGAMQRDKLLDAVLALANLYGGTHDDMETLDAALARFGRAHAAFQRPDGTVKGATEAEYDAVRDILFGVLVEVCGPAWTADHSAAWAEAYSYAKTGMLWAQYHSGFTAPRYPRHDEPRAGRHA